MSREGPPVGYTAEHASSSFRGFGKVRGLNLDSRCALTPEQRLRFSDYGTDQTVPDHGRFVVVGKASRGIIDLNRDPHHPKLYPTEDFAKPIPNDIWRPGEELTIKEKQQVFDTIYVPYHDKILEEVRGFGRPALLVAWHNTDDRPGYVIGNNESGEPQNMLPIILSNNGAEGRAESDPDRGETTCDPDLLLTLAGHLSSSLGKRGLPDEVHLNIVYRGGHTTQRYNTRGSAVDELNLDHDLQSVQVEYGTGITHDDRDPSKPNAVGMRKLTEAFSEAIDETCKSLGSADNF